MAFQYMYNKISCKVEENFLRKYFARNLRAAVLLDISGTACMSTAWRIPEISLIGYLGKQRTSSWCQIYELESKTINL
jgi:hypothetical protein